MGLDMYLYLVKSEYQACYSFTPQEEKDKCVYPKELKELEEGITKRNFKSIATEIYYQVGYWRKANAIHKWFVDMCGDGIDECQEIYVRKQGLEELRKICNQVLKNHELASELLPTKDGFFFGDIDYDDWYFNDLKYTRDLLNQVIDFLDKNNDYKVIYQASW